MSPVEVSGDKTWTIRDEVLQQLKIKESKFEIHRNDSSPPTKTHSFENHGLLTLQVSFRKSTCNVLWLLPVNSQAGNDSDLH